MVWDNRNRNITEQWKYIQTILFDIKISVLKITKINRKEMDGSLAILRTFQQYFSHIRMKGG